MGWLSDLLKRYSVVAVAKERVALSEEKLKQVEDENNRLRVEIVSLRSENEELHRKVSSLEKRNQFTEASGVLWKRSPSGSIEPIAYCPQCELAMATFPPDSNEMVLCSKCNFRAPFLPIEMKKIAERLSAPPS